MRSMRYLLILLAFAAPCLGMRLENGDISLRQEPPPIPKVQGVAFGGPANEALQALALQGLKVTDREVVNREAGVQRVVFQGVPKELAVINGTTTVLTFDGKLTQMSITFTPSYQNFLLLRQLLTGPANNRFVVADQRVAMEALLKTRLAHMRGKEFGNAGEEAVTASMVEGKTFYHYTFRDTQGSVMSILTYAARPNRSGEMEPHLQLYYSDREQMQKYKEYLAEQAKAGR